MTSWLRRWSLPVAAASAYAVVGLSFLPEHVFTHRYKEMLAYYERAEDGSGSPMPLTEELAELVEGELKRFSPDDASLPKLDVFLTDRLTEVSAGSFRNSKGATLGLPYTFRLSSGLVAIKALTNDFSQLVDNELTATSLAANWLLSDDAKRYYVSRELYVLNQAKLFWQMASFSAAVLAGVTIFVTAAATLRTSDPAVAIRLAFVSFGLSLAVLISLLGLRNHRVELAADDYCASLGPRYLLGGIEFYDQRLRRNALLHTLGQTSIYNFGFKDFSATGNETFWFGLHATSGSRYDRLKQCYDAVE